MVRGQDRIDRFSKAQALDGSGQLRSVARNWIQHLELNAGYLDLLVTAKERNYEDEKTVDKWGAGP